MATKSPNDEYAFAVSTVVTVRVTAATEAEARKKMFDALTADTIQVDATNDDNVEIDNLAFYDHDAITKAPLAAALGRRCG